MITKRVLTPLIILIILFPYDLKAQHLKYITDSNFTNYYQIKIAFEKEWQLKESNAKATRKTTSEEGFHEKENDYIHFKRWEEFVGPRVYPSGDLRKLSSTYENLKSYKDSIQQKNKLARIAVTTPWSFVGPPGTNVGGRNAGRMNFIRFDPKNTSVIYAGAPAGGLWKTTDGGKIWRTNTDYLSVLGCSDLGIDPKNTSIMYLGTGDNDGGSTRSMGVLKTTDGGLSWLETGLKWTVGQGKQISRILVNPTNTQIVIAAASDGIYRTTDGGQTWTKTLTNSGYIKDAELKPDDPNIVYANSTKLYRSTNGGATWTAITGGLPTDATRRICLAVTPANANYVYMLYTDGSGDFKGLYRSVDAGLNFTLRSNSPNIVGYDLNATGNQSGYDLTLACSPANAEVLLAAGVRNCRSTDGGATWVLATKDCTSSTLELHWDIHYVEFVPGSATNAFAACDGGVYKTINTGDCWTPVNADNISVNQIYRLGVAADNPEIMISGHQDGATIVHTNATYRDVLGGDGMDCFIDRTNSKTMYGSVYNGAFNRSIDGGIRWTAVTSGLTGRGAWVSPWCQDPISANTIWAGYEQVFKSTNRGDSWSQFGTIAGSGSLRDIRVAPSNSAYVYACRPRELYITKNNGGTWTNISAGLPFSQVEITRIAVSEKDPLHAWVTFSGYTANQKVYETINGGSTWKNISGGIPNLPVNCVTYVPGSTTDEIYIGADVGVYYKNNSRSTWVSYFEGLAYAPVYDIDIYAKGKELRVATYGRGIWKAPLFEDKIITSADEIILAKELNSTDNFSVYPNPFMDMVMVIAPGSISSVRLTNSAGQEISVENFESTGLIKTGNLSKGYYTLEVTITDGRKWIQKLIKE